MAQDPLFGAITTRIEAHVSWYYTDGWVLTISSWSESDSLDDNHRHQYHPANLEELETILDAELDARHRRSSYGVT